MLSETLIRRRCRQQDHDRLLQDLVRNGLPMPLPLRVRLADSPVAAPALALRRLTELTYGPTPASKAITARLLDLEDDRGGWDGDPLATACGAAALDRLVRSGRRDAALTVGRDRAIAALLGMQRDDGSFAAASDRTDADRLMTTAFVLYLLADCTRFTESVRLADLLSFIEARIDAADDATDELWQMARLVLRPLPGARFATPAPAVAA